MNFSKYTDILITTSTDNTVGVATDVTQIPYNSATNIVPTAELTQETDETKEDIFPPEVLDPMMEELKDPLPEEPVEVSQFLQIEEKLLGLCMQLFDEDDELMKYKRSKLVDSFNATKYQLAKSLQEAQKQLGVVKRDMWNEKWPVIDSVSGVSALQDSHRSRREEILERHRRELAEFDTYCEGEIAEFKRQLPQEKKHVAIRYKQAKEEHDQTAEAAQSACIGSLRGMLGSTFPIIRNRYQIGSLITATSSSVFKGVDLQTMELVAVKAFPPQVTLNTTLSHETLVPIVDVCATPASMYVVMKMMPATLSSFVKTQPGRVVPLGVVKEILHTLLRSLVFLHEHSLVVRDLRPSGVLVDSNNRPRLIHLGVMRALLGDADSEPPENGMVYGAPEIFGRVVNTASDIWSLGCIFLFLMQTNEERLMPIFYGSDPSAILETMVQLIGRPTLEQLDEMATACNMAEDGSELLQYIGKVPILPGDSAKEQLAKLCSRADDVALDLLLDMLKFIPSERVTAEEALHHKYFSGFVPTPILSTSDFIPVSPTPNGHFSSTPPSPSPPTNISPSHALSTPPTLTLDPTTNQKQVKKEEADKEQLITQEAKEKEYLKETLLQEGKEPQSISVSEVHEEGDETETY